MRDAFASLGHDTSAAGHGDAAQALHTKHNPIRLEPADDVRAAIAAFRLERKRVAAETKAAGASGEAPMDVS